jgi:hypothetical protein
MNVNAQQGPQKKPARTSASSAAYAAIARFDDISIILRCLRKTERHIHLARRGRYEWS